MPWSREQEPLRFVWSSGEASLGYLGHRRWRCATEAGVVEVDDTEAATRQLLAAAFAGVPAGQEVAARAPVRITGGHGLSASLVADHRLASGWTYDDGRVRADIGSHSWTYDDGRVRADIGSHSELHVFLRALLARNADHDWAIGVVPIRPIPLGDEFSFSYFAADTRPDDRCRQLAAAINERIQDNPSPVRAVEVAIDELRSLGHDLWSWEPDEVWGRDYVTPRKGAGLTVTLYAADEDDEDDPEASGIPHVLVEFQPPGAR